MDCAASLLELLQCGLVQLKRPGGQGVLRLYADNEDLDEWWVKGRAAVGADRMPEGEGKVSHDVLFLLVLCGG